MASVLSTFFSRDPTATFSFEVCEKYETQPSGSSNFCRCKARRKGSNDEFTLFSVDFKTIKSADADIAKGCAKRLKTLKHPAFLTFVDSLETDALLLVVTEPAIPLVEYLESLKHSSLSLRHQLISWGIHQIASGINFLNQDAGLIHDNIHVGSVFVTKCGDWKLFGLEYIRPVSEAQSKPCKLFDLQRYSCPDSRLSAKSPPWTTDCWGLACLIWEVFNGCLPKSDNTFSILKSPKLIEKSMHAAYAKLISSSPCSPVNFIAICRQGGNFMDNQLVDFLLRLEQFQINEATEKMKFFSQYNKDFIATLPENILKYKILPQLLNIYEFGDAGVKILTPMLQIDDFINYLSPAVLNDKIFPHFVSGLSDTNPAVRENTLKAVIHIAPKLNYNNLNVELMKHLARLQAKDDQPGIRTNATVCLGKIAAFLDPQMRKKVLITAFTRPFADNFAPARLAGVLALTATEKFYASADVGQKILPQLCILTVDGDSQVRGPVFKAIRGFLEKLEQAADDPNPGDAQAENTPVKGVENVPQWASWAISALSSRFYKAPSSSPHFHSEISCDPPDMPPVPHLTSENFDGKNEPNCSEKIVEVKELDIKDGWAVDQRQSLEVSFPPAGESCSPKKNPVKCSSWDLEDWPED